MRRSITRAVVRCRFAARPGVKRLRFVETSPEYPAEIDAVRREIPGPLLCTLGSIDLPRLRHRAPADRTTFQGRGNPNSPARHPEVPGGNGGGMIRRRNGTNPVLAKESSAQQATHGGHALRPDRLTAIRALVCHAPVNSLGALTIFDDLESIGSVSSIL